MNNKKGILGKVLSILGFILCGILAFLLICNLVIIIKGSLKPETPPSVLGITPMVVMSGSMSGNAPDHIEVNDLIFVSKVDPKDIKEGDVICFMDGKIAVTHRVVTILEQPDGTRQFRTKGDANNTEDKDSVSEDNIVGRYRTRIPKLGGVAMFLQTPIGMILFIGIPLLAFIIYDFCMRKRSRDRESQKTEELKAEIRRLQALNSEKEASEKQSEDGLNKETKPESDKEN